MENNFRITKHMDSHTALEALAEGNPACQALLDQLVIYFPRIDRRHFRIEDRRTKSTEQIAEERALKVLHMVDEVGLYGEKLYTLYANTFGANDIHKMAQLIRAHPALVSRDDLYRMAESASAAETSDFRDKAAEITHIARYNIRKYGQIIVPLDANPSQPRRRDNSRPAGGRRPDGHTFHGGPGLKIG